MPCAVISQVGYVTFCLPGLFRFTYFSFLILSLFQILTLHGYFHVVSSKSCPQTLLQLYVTELFIALFIYFLNYKFFLLCLGYIPMQPFKGSHSIPDMERTNISSM